MLRILERKAFVLFMVIAISLLLAAIYDFSGQPSTHEIASPMKIAAVGDSNTYGAGVFANRDKYSYPAQLQSLLGSRYKVYNYGVGGSTLLSTSNLPYVKQIEYEESRQLQPDIVLIMLGTNDAAQQNFSTTMFKAELSSMVTTYAQLRSHPTIYLLTPPASYTYRDAVIEKDIIPAIQQVAELTNVQLVDIHTPTSNKSDIFPDGTHPTEVGYRIIAEAVGQRIETHKSVFWLDQ